MPSNVLAWPENALEHEARSIRLHLGNSVDSPPEIRYRRREAPVKHPSIFINLLTTRTRPNGQFHWYNLRTGVLTWYGSDDKDMNETERDEESLRALDWLSTRFMQVSYGVGVGPLIPILDFSKEEPEETGDYIEMQGETSFDRRLDQFGLWIVTSDIRYEVEQSTTPTGPIITEVKREFSLAL